MPIGGIEVCDGVGLIFRSGDTRSKKPKGVNCRGEDFIGRFFLHVLPHRFVKVRSYGLFSSNSDGKLRQARALLEAVSAQPAPAPSTGSQNNSLSFPSPAPRLCPRCQSGHLILIASLLPQRTRGP